MGRNEEERGVLAIDRLPCTGVFGDFSVVRDLYGYATGVYGHFDLATVTADDVKIDPAVPGRLSLRTQMKLSLANRILLVNVMAGGSLAERHDAHQHGAGSGAAVNSSSSQ